MSPASLVEALRDPERGELRFGLGVIVAALVAARLTAGSQTAALVAVLMMLLVPVVALRARDAGPALCLVAAVGAWLVFRTSFGDPLPPFPVLLIRRLAYIAAPAIALGMVLNERARARLHVGPVHIYGPAVVMAIAAAVHLFLREPTEAHERETDIPATVYALCYVALIAIAAVLRLQEAPAPAAQRAAAPPQLAPGEELEEQGRYALAARAYEREGRMDKAAEAAERAGEWPRAGRLHKANGQDFKAGEAFARAQMWKEALDCYERSRSWAAAARVCVQIGDVDRAVKVHQLAGDPAAVVRVLEEAGRKPSAEQYARAGQFAKAAEAHAAAGDWQRAAEVYEHKAGDRAKAAEMQLRAGAFVRAGRLLEALGRTQEALEAYAAAPEGAVDAARLCLAAGQPQQAAQLLGRLSPERLEAIEDEGTLIVAAKVMLESGQGDDAVRLLQGMKRRGSGTGPVRMLLGRAFLDGGLVELAEEELRAASELPMEPGEELRAKYLLGCVLEMRGESADALRAFHEVMQTDLHYQDVQERYRRLRRKGGTAPG
jgi:tetratricopeptide (TPR) repeat protein